jgi:tetratricopeptide (TPR) repeat protein
VTTSAGAGGSKASSPQIATPASHAPMAVATLELTAAPRDAFQSILLVAPLKDSLAGKKSAMERALAGYQQAVGYAVAEVTTAATYEMGELYRRLAADLMKSERPANLDPESLEQYDLLLEEQAFPFEEKAIEVHELNARRVADGLYDEWVKKSYAVLAEVEPARFGKQAEPEPFVAHLELPAPSVSPLPPAPVVEMPSRRRKSEEVTEAEPPPAITPATEQQFANAVQLLEAGDFAGARPLLEQLVASEPSLAAPAVNLGMLHARERRWSDAESALAEGHRRDPADAVALNELAAVQRENGRFKDAEATYRQALDADPAHARTHRNFAVLLDLYLWRPAEALRHFETYVSMSGTTDRQVSGWIAELKRRVGDVAQTAGVQP